MQRIASGVLLHPLVLAAAVVSAGEDAPVPVRLLAVSGVGDDARKALRGELKGPYESARVALREAEKRLRQAHGKKQETWPTEATAELEGLRETRDKALFAYLFDATKEKDVAKALEGLTKNLSDNELTPLVASEAEAVLIVELLGRSRKSVRGSGPWACLGLKITAGDKADSAAFEKLLVETEYGDNTGIAGREARAYHVYSAEQPFWHVDGCGRGIAWKMASNGGEVIIQELAKQYNAALAEGDAETK